MIAKGCLHICLVMFFFKEILSWDCNNVGLQLSTTSKHSLEILKSKIRTNLLLQCIEDERDFMHAHNILKEIKQSLKETPKVVIHEILQQIVHLFNQNLTGTAWDEYSIAALQTRLHQQVKQLGACLNAEMENGIPSLRSLNIQLTRLRVKRYFRRVSAFLRENQLNLCAWEMAQMQVKQCLLLVDQLIRRIQN